jgi:hypothetical protein
MNDKLAATYRASQRDLYAENQALRAENAELRATIIEADSAFNLDGHVSDWEETASLVRLCHEGRAALDELTKRHSEQTR